MIAEENDKLYVPKFRYIHNPLQKDTLWKSCQMNFQLTGEIF